jgi:hypothetical protein
MLSNQFCWILNIMDYQLKILNPMLSILILEFEIKYRNWPNLI